MIRIKGDEKDNFKMLYNNFSSEMDIVSHVFKLTKYKKIYKRKVVNATLWIFQSWGFQCPVLVKGTFANVVELKSMNSDMQLAAKIVAEKYSTEGETKLLFHNLKHENILLLLSCQYSDSVHTTVFLMHIQSTSLDCKILEKEFIEDITSRDKATSWMNGKLQRVAYIHEKSLCHLDLKPNNVLISLRVVTLDCKIREKEFIGDVTDLERATSLLNYILQEMANIHEKNLCHLDLKSKNVSNSLRVVTLDCKIQVKEFSIEDVTDLKRATSLLNGILQGVACIQETESDLKLANDFFQRYRTTFCDF